VGAHDAGAPRKRDRIWILAYAESERGRAGLCEDEQKQDRNKPANGGGNVADPASWMSRQQAERKRGEGVGRRGGDCRRPSKTGGDVSHTDKLHGHSGGHGTSQICRERKPTKLSGSKSNVSYSGCRGGKGKRAEQCGGEVPSWWESEPDVGRVAYGLAARVDRLRGLGNGQVPSVVRLAWRLWRIKKSTLRNSAE